MAETDKPMVHRANRKTVQNAFMNLVRTEDSQPDDNKQYSINNISSGGLQFASNDNFEVDERIEVTIHFSDGSNHYAHARICYCNKTKDEIDGYNYGASFLDNYLMS